MQFEQTNAAMIVQIQVERARIEALSKLIKEQRSRLL